MCQVLSTDFHLVYIYIHSGIHIHTFIIKQKMESKGSESNGSDKSNPEVSLIFKGHWTQLQSTSTDPDVSSGTNPFNPR